MQIDLASFSIKPHFTRNKNKLKYYTARKVFNITLRNYKNYVYNNNSDHLLLSDMITWYHTNKN